MGDASRGSIEEKHLQAGLGISRMYLQGVRDTSPAALNRSLQIAEARGNAAKESRASITQFVYR